MATSNRPYINRIDDALAQKDREILRYDERRCNLAFSAAAHAIIMDGNGRWQGSRGCRVAVIGAAPRAAGRAVESAAGGTASRISHSLDFIGEWRRP